MNKVETELRRTYMYTKEFGKLMVNPSEDNLKKYWENKNKLAVMVLKAEKLDPAVANTICERISHECCSIRTELFAF